MIAGLLVLCFQMFVLFCNYAFVEMFLNRTNLHILYSEETENSKEGFLYDFGEELKAFSKRYHVNIAQYTYVDDQKINIYATNIEADWDIAGGQLPKGEEYVSNKRFDTSPMHVGYLFAPISIMEIKVWEFEQIRNVGLMNDLYMNTADEDILDAFVQAFSKYGDIEVSKAYVNSLVFNNSILFGITINMLFLSILAVFAYMFLKRKQIQMLMIWGYSKGKSAVYMARKFKYAYYMVLFMNMLFLLYNWLQGADMGTLLYYFVVGVGITGAIFIGFVLFIYLCVLIIYQTDQNVSGLKGKRVLIGSRYMTYIFQVALLIFVLVVSGKLNNSLSTLVQRQKALDVWERTKTFYRIVYSPVDNRADSSWSKDRARNIELEQFYQLLDVEKHGILIDAMNFYVANRGEEKLKYAYEEGVDPFLSPYGNGITINSNYLDYNPIVGVDEVDIRDMLVYDSYVLNVLVSERYKGEEQNIRNEYMQAFYAQKVEVDNLYNTALGLPQNETAAEDLSLHIIYYKEGQGFFTYNAELGNRENEVIDPIVMVYTGNEEVELLDSSAIAADVTHSVFFESDSLENAYGEIQELVERTGAEIRQVESVYNQLGRAISHIQNKILQDVISTFFLLLFFVISIMLSTWLFYQRNAEKISLKSIWGYSAKKIYGKLLLEASVIIMVAVVFTLYFTSNPLFAVGLGAVLLCIELGLIYIFGKKVENRYLLDVLKGGNA